MNSTCRLKFIVNIVHDGNDLEDFIMIGCYANLELHIFAKSYVV